MFSCFHVFSHVQNGVVRLFLRLLREVPEVAEVALLVVRLVLEGIDHLYHHRLTYELPRLNVKLSLFGQTFQRQRCLGRIIGIDLIVYHFKDSIPQMLIDPYVSS